MRVLRARGAQLEQEFAFGVVRQLFEPALAARADAERGAVLQGAGGAGRRPARAPGATRRTPRRPADSSFAVLHGLYWLCANLAAERPLCLVVDDAHWADTPSLRYLAFLLPRLEELPRRARARRPAGRGRRRARAARRAHRRRRRGAGHAGAAEPGRRRPAGRRGPRARARGRLRRRLPRTRRAATRSSSASSSSRSRRTASRRSTPRRPASRRSARAGRRAGSCCGSGGCRRRPRCSRARSRSSSRASCARGRRARGARRRTTAVARRRRARRRPGILAPGRPLRLRPSDRARRDLRRHRPRRAGARAPRGGDGCWPTAHAPRRAGRRAPAGERAGGRRRGWSSGWSARRAPPRAQARPSSAAVYLRRAPGGAARARASARRCCSSSASRRTTRARHGALAHMEAATDAAATARERLSAALVLGHALARDNRFAEAVEVLDRAAAASGRTPTSALSRAAEALAASTATFSVRTAQAHARRIRRGAHRRRHRRGASHEQLALAGQLAVRSNEPAEVAAGLALRALAAARGALPGADRPAVVPPVRDHAAVGGALRRAPGNARRGGGGARGRGATRASSRARSPTAAGCRCAAAICRRPRPTSRTALEAANLPAPAMYRLRATAVLVEALTERGLLDAAEQVLAPIEAQRRGRLHDRGAAADEPRPAAARAAARRRRRSPTSCGGRGGDARPRS